MELIFQPGLGDDGGELGVFQKLYVFYRTPIVKYTGSCISFASLLLLYSYVAIFGYRYQYQTPELILYVWVGILIIEECRQVRQPTSFEGLIMGLHQLEGLGYSLLCLHWNEKSYWCKQFSFPHQADVGQSLFSRLV